MAASSSPSSAKNNVTPQATGGGFSQVHARGGGGGEGGGQAMSVLLSWHEKVSFVLSRRFLFSFLVLLFSSLTPLPLRKYYQFPILLEFIKKKKG